MQSPRHYTIAPFVTVVMCLLATRAQATQAPSSLIEAARTAAAAEARAAGVNNPTVSVATPDSRLRLADCPAPLAARLSGQARLPGRAVAKVSCPVAPGWSIHLPLTVQAKAAVLVAARPLPRGHRLQASDLSRQVVELGTLNGQYLIDDQAAVGQALRRSVGHGERLTPTLLQAAMLVRRGEPVVMQLQSANFVIHANGMAMSSGSSGERITVQNVGSKRVVHGVVTGEGKVTVEF